MSKNYKNIIVEKDEISAKIILNKLPVNILDIEMMNEINDAIVDFQKDSTFKVLVISANGKAFSAGVDVSDHTPEKVDEMIFVFHKIFENLRKIKQPTIAVVKGAALGGGCEVATFCDLVVASEKAKFGQPEIKVGVFPPIACFIFPRLCGKKGLELILNGDIITSQEAKKIGLINQVFPLEKFEEEVEKYISKITGNSSIVLQLSKKAVMDSIDFNYEGAMNIIEDIYLTELMKTHDAKEGLKAFLEKRIPEWKNR